MPVFRVYDEPEFEHGSGWLVVTESYLCSLAWLMPVHNFIYEGAKKTLGDTTVFIIPSDSVFCSFLEISSVYNEHR